MLINASKVLLTLNSKTKINSKRLNEENKNIFFKLKLKKYCRSKIKWQNCSPIIQRFVFIIFSKPELDNNITSQWWTHSKNNTTQQYNQMLGDTIFFKSKSSLSHI